MTNGAEHERSSGGPARSARLLQLVIDSIPQRVFWKDRDSRYLGCNRSFARDAGLDDPALIVGKTDFELAWKATAHLYVADDRLVMESNTPKIDIEEPMTFPDGRTIWLRTSKVPLRSEGDAVFGVLGMYEDVTEQRRAAIDRARLAEIVEQASEDVIMTDVDGNITYVNPAFERSSGYSRREVEGQNPRFLKGARRDAKFYTELWQTLTSGGVWSGHFINKRKDGTLFEEEGSIFPVRNHAGQIVSYVAIKRDVTQEVRLKEQLLQAQKMESVGRLAGGIAHDFNNLLTVILGYVELAAGRLKPEDPSRLELSEIDKAARRAADLTRQLLAFSRKQVLELRVIDLNRVVSNTHKMLRRLIGEDIELVTSLKERLGSVKADTGQIEQVLLNLVVNSRDAMPEGGRLTIETSEVELDESYSTFHFDVPPGRYVVLAVSDTGTGMDAKTLSHVFEPFFTTKEAGKGTGLGLSTVYGVVKQSGGHVTAYSEPGVGTTFKIYLPRVEDAPQMDRASSAHVALAGGTETVLVVEDEEAIRRLTCRALEAYGYTVLSAASAREAIRLCEEHAGEIHLILTDVVMPGMSGRELARSAAALRPLVKVLFMSGYTDNVIVHHGVLDAGTPFLQKPFTPRSLAQKVREVLDAR
ncbi:MAG: PAS domain S-box protein [Thermoanaerobaculia bacterium]